MAVANAPKPPPDRVTLSARRLSQARGVVFLICGADKREALTLWRQGAIIPATSIQPLAGIDLLIDTDACPPGEPE
jgi:6-phosphogluconolactonase